MKKKTGEKVRARMGRPTIAPEDVKRTIAICITPRVAIAVGVAASNECISISAKWEQIATEWLAKSRN